MSHENPPFSGENPSPQPPANELGQIAGIRPPRFDDLTVDTVQTRLAQVLLDHYDQAEFNAERRGFDPNQSGEDRDNRLPALSFNLYDPHAPSYDFLITWPLLRQMRQLPTITSRNKLIQLALEQGEDAVNPAFTADAINAINASYYQSRVAFDRDTGPATLYTDIRPMNAALGVALVANSQTGGKTLRVKELCSGRYPGHWWDIADTALQRGATSLDVTLSDLITAPIDTNDQVEILNMHAERYSLLDDMPNLPTEDRYDAIITTYGFDSVWQPEDSSFERKEDGQWYQNFYRVKVAQWNERDNELLQALRRGEPLANASPKDYDGIAIELAQQPIDLSTHPYGQYITEYGQDSINFPGGVIKRVVEAFEHQLTENGTFIIGDVGYFGNGNRDFMPSRPALSGIAARFREDDFVLAKTILEQRFGLKVSLQGLEEFVDSHLGHDWKDAASAEELELVTHSPGNGVMIVTR